MLETSIWIHAALWVVGWWLLVRFPKLPPGGKTTSLSVIIPARNEAHNLPTLLASLGRQAIPPLEIIVVDDGSEDGTGALARGLGARVAAPEAPPEGWRGKNWACHQGALAARGEVLLFLDADTTLAPDALGKIAGFVQANGTLSLQPYHLTVRAYEQLSAYFNLVQMMGSGAFTPLGNRAPGRRMSGPCLAISRQDYLRSGGHGAVRQEGLETAALSKVLEVKGIPFACAAGRGVIGFRMYPRGLRELVQGWARSFGSGAGLVPLWLLLPIMAWFAGALGTFRHMATAAVQGDPRAWALAGFYLLYAAQIRWMLKHAGNFRSWVALAYPAGMGFFVAVFLWSLLLRLGVGRREWKGRPLA